jgi:hypothetical protein
MVLSPLAKKLYIRANQRLLAVSAPDEFLPLLEPLPEGTTLDTTPADGIEYDGVYLFARTAEQAAEAVPIALAAAKFDGSFWSVWPKDNAKRKQNLTRDTGWEPLYQAGLTPVASVSINEAWSSLRWRPVERVGK